MTRQPRRGQLWRYQAVGRDRLVLIVSHNALNEAGEFLAVDVDTLTTEGPLSVLSVQIDDLCHARCYRIGLLNPKNLAECINDEVPTGAMDQVDAALRDVLGLQP